MTPPCRPFNWTISSTIATKSLSTWHHCHSYKCSYYMSWRRLVPLSTRTRNQNVAERGYLPRVGHCGIHIVLPSEPWIAALGSTWAPLPTTSTWCRKTALLLHTYACTWWHSSRPSSSLFPSFWPGTASFTLLPLSMPPGNRATQEAGILAVSRA